MFCIVPVMGAIYSVQAVLSFSQLCNAIAEEGSRAATSYSICYVKCSKELFNSYTKHSNEPVLKLYMR